MPKLPQDRDVWRIAAPMILSNLSAPLLGMVDTGVVGHLDNPSYLGAVAIGSTIFGLLYTGVNFLRMGTTGIAAQRYGANDFDGLRTTLGQALIVSTLIALTLLLLQWPIAALAMHLIGAEASTSAYAQEYFSIRIWSAPGTLANYALIGWFIGLQNARIPLLIFLTINLTNIALDLLFVIVFDMDIAGVALASVIAEYTALLLGLFFTVRTLQQHQGQWQIDKLLRLRRYKAFFTVNANLFIRTMSLVFAFAYLTAQGARLGELVLAANAILLNLQNLTAFGLDGFAHAAEALVGKAIGEKRRDSVLRAVRLCLKWSLIFSVIFTLAFLLGGSGLVYLLTDLDDVRTTALHYLPWLIISPLVSVWSFLYDGVFVGATRAREMRNSMLLSTFLVFLPSWYLLQGLGNHGLWLAFTIFMASRGLGMHIYYRRTVLPNT